MKRIFYLSLSVALMLLLTGCDKLFGGSSSTGFTIDYIAFQEEEDGKWGLMDLNGNIILQPKFDNQPSSVVNDCFSVYDMDEEHYTLYKLTDEGKVEKIGKYKDVGAFTGKYCPVVDDNKNISYIDKEGNKVLDLKKIKGKKTIQAYNFFDGLAMVKLENGKWGYIDENGETVIPFKYYDAWNFNEGLGIVYLADPDEDGAKWSVLDTKGEVVFTKKFKEMTPDDFRFIDGLLDVRMPAGDDETKPAIINKQGEIVKKLKEGCSVTSFHNNYFVVYNYQKEKYSLMNTEGETIIKDKYSTLNYNGKILVGATGGDNDKYYLLTMEGEKIKRLPKGYVVLFDPEYKNYDTRMLVGKYNEGYVLVDEKGEEVDCEAEIFDYGMGYYWGVNAEEYEEYDDIDYGEPEYYDDAMDEEIEEADSVAAVG